MNVAFICDVFGEANNGTVIAALNFINYLRSCGDRVFVVSPEQGPLDKADFFDTGKHNFGPLLNYVFKINGVVIAKTDRDLLREIITQCDVVHLLLPFALSRAALEIAKELGKPVTASFHCQAENISAHFGIIGSDSADKVIYKDFYSHFFKYVDAIHFPTEFIKKEFTRFTGCTVPAYVISNGVNKAFFDCGRDRTAAPASGRETADSASGNAKKKFTIVCTGRFSREKSQETLIKAVARSPHRSDVRVIFAGTGPLENKLVKLAERRKVDAEFRFFSREEMITVLRGADIYVHTATVEIEAIACAEAIVSGLPAIICNSPKSATRFFAVDKKMLFAPKNYVQLAARIDFFINRPEMIDVYREKYAKETHAFDQDNCMRGMRGMLLDVIEKTTGHRPPEPGDAPAEAKSNPDPITQPDADSVNKL